jgi:hypothetical protein
MPAADRPADVLLLPLPSLLPAPALHLPSDTPALSPRKALLTPHLACIDLEITALPPRQSLLLFLLLLGTLRHG